MKLAHLCWTCKRTSTKNGKPENLSKNGIFEENIIYVYLNAYICFWYLKMRHINSPLKLQTHMAQKIPRSVKCWHMFLIWRYVIAWEISNNFCIIHCETACSPFTRDKVFVDFIWHIFSPRLQALLIFFKTCFSYLKCWDKNSTWKRVMPKSLYYTFVCFPWQLSELNDRH